MSALYGCKVLLGVSGGIAAYKSPDLVRRLRERGAEVQVVMTAGAQRFVTPTTCQAVSGREVRADVWDPAAEAAMGHIELARWADLVLVAPATADVIARIASGRADDLLTTLVLATEAPVMIAPAMNRVMWAKPVTQANIGTLRARGITICGPDVGDQACGETGTGRMLEPKEIAEVAAEVVSEHGVGPVDATTRAALTGKRVLVTAGPTRERIDPVRYLTNRSSGKMGFAIAAAACAAGAEVTLVAGPVNLPTPAGVRRIDTLARRACGDEHTLAGLDVFIGAAAVADYRPTAPSPRKIKKTAERIELALERTTDILARVAARADRPFTVGFAAETEDVERYARGKLETKRLDLIAANEVGDCKAFDVDDNALVVLSAEGREEIAHANKIDVARRLVALIAAHLSKTARRVPV